MGKQPNEIVKSGGKERFKCWKTIEGVDNRLGFRDFHEKIKKSGADIDRFTLDAEWWMTVGIKMAKIVGKRRGESGNIELALVSPANLGFNKKDKIWQKEFYNRAFKGGLGLCSPKLAMQICSQYIDQPKGESIFVAMDPIVGNEYRYEHDVRPPAKYSVIFKIAHGNNGRTISCMDLSDQALNKDSLWAFRFLGRK